MIVEAIDKRTGKTVKIEEAHSGQRLTCPHCDVDMHPVLGVNTPFFRCYEGRKHSNYLCEQLERTNRAYDPQLTDIAQLFAHLFNPVREKEDPSGKPKEDESPDVSDPENGVLHGGESEQNTVVDTDDGKEDESKATSGPVVLPCRTLSQLWKAGISKLEPSKPIGSFLRSDVFLWYKDFDRFFAHRESLRKRVIAVKPYRPVYKANAILFTSFSKIPETKKYKRKYFALKFGESKEYNTACKKLFSLNTDSAGTNHPKSKYNMVLVAGDWRELNNEEYAAFGVADEDIYGVQCSRFYSKNQIYPIPQQKIKE